MDDFVRSKLTEWCLSELIKDFEEEGIGKETFLSLGESDDINDLIPKIGPRAKFRKRLKEYLAWNCTETCDFVRDKLTEWDLKELIPRFEDEGIDKEKFLRLGDSDAISALISKIGPRVKFRKRLSEYLQSEEPGTNRGLTTDLLAVILFILRHHLTASASDLMALLNFIEPDLFVAPENVLDKIPALSAVFYCSKCKGYIGKNPADDRCNHCGQTFNKKSSIQNGHFFLFASLKDLLKDILQNYGDELMDKKINGENDITDIKDGKMYQNLLHQGILAPDDITLSWNCDEVPIYNSAICSIWPIQFTINELPYTRRYENIAVAGFWFGQEKPSMNTFLKPFVDECCDLAQNPFKWMNNGQVRFSKVFCLVCSSDAVARPLLRNCTQFNGEHGCDWCLHPGTMVGKGRGHMRSYTYDENKQLARSNKMFKDDAKRDIVLGFVPEYLHSVLLGVSKQLMSLWLDPANSLKPWYVGEKISEMDSRLRHIKTPSEISTSPQSLQCRDKWKASEWRAFLLFYAVSVLPGILVPPYLEHYLSFSFSIHILLQESVSQQDLHLAHRTLVYFVEYMAKLYGEENTTFNCHQLIHLTQSVENWGPLWATSAFNFERNNGNLRTLLKGVKVKSQVHQRFLLWLHLPSHLSSSVFNKKCSFSELLAKVTPVKDGSSSDKAFGNPHQVELTGSTQRAIAEFLNQPVYAKTADACDRFLHGHTVYQASNCKESDKTDCFVQLNNGSYGDIQWILRLKESCVCKSNCWCQAAPVFVLQLYNIKPSTLFSAAHPNTSKAIFIRVEKADQVKACSLEDIRCKCVYVDGWLVPLPNTYER
ncbi:uncharacterized protein V6R79_005250 [Siganus canaliculatus]